MKKIFPTFFAIVGLAILGLSQPVSASNLSVAPVTLFPAALAVGSSATAEYKVTNHGNVALHHIALTGLPSIVETDVPTGTPSCDMMVPLAPGASCYFGLAIHNITADTVLQESQHLPAVSANDGQYVSYPVLAEQRLNVIGITPTTDISTSVTGLPENMLDGSEHAVTVVFNNQSTHTLTSVTAQLASSDGFVLNSSTCTGTMAIGDSCQVNATYTVPLDASGPISLFVSLNSAQSDDVVAALSSTITNVVVTGSAVPLPTYINRGVTYLMGYSFTNTTDDTHGGGAASEVSVQLTPPTGATMGNGCADVTSLAQGASCLITGQYKVPNEQADPVAFDIALAYAQGADVNLAKSSSVLTGAGVKCWGSNFFGELGDGTSDYRNVPVDVSNLGSGVVAITAGSVHSCALLNTGEMKCWGHNYYGQLGNNSTTNSTTPVDVLSAPDQDNLSGVVAITGGSAHTCALLNIGEVKCWGGNTYGQLGNGDDSFVNQYTPADVKVSQGRENLSGVVAISGGAIHTCALLATGAVKCWGSNWKGALGNNAGSGSLNGGKNNLPVDVWASSVGGTLSGVVAITGGDHFSCALLNTGEVKCWGENDSGQLGDISTVNRYTPVYVKASPTGGNLTGVIALASGGDHVCALLNTGEVKCWGNNYYGQLGDNSTVNRYTPVYVKASPTGGNLTGVIAITAGPRSTCVLMYNGEVKCWGANHYGQLGNGKDGDRYYEDANQSTPVNVKLATNGDNLAGVVALAGNGEDDGHYCALTTS